MKTLHFTLGPVQGFVSQARRTRDLWAGSFLLSYLSGHAIKAVLDAGGEIIFPKVQEGKDVITDPLLAAICKTPLTDNAEPKIGSLPNRFKASVPDDFCGKLCEKAVQDAWQNIANEVWNKFFQHLDGKQQQDIWNEQVGSFWDISWVIGTSPDGKSDNTWLDKRKNWRTYMPPVQQGDKCTLMGSWQELSGFVRANQREAQDTFWQTVRDTADMRDLDLADNERLCAIALIKRLFPYVAFEAIGWSFAREVSAWASTSYFAAVPWLEAIETNDKALPLADQYVGLVRHHLSNDIFGEMNTQLGSLSNRRFNTLDGRLYYRHNIEAEKDIKHKDDQGNCVSTKYNTSEAEAKRALTSHLKDISNAVGYEPSPFYALLLMDGDSLGKLLHKLEPENVSSALADFTNQVEGIVSKYHGKTVYAGGDDVLALLPLDQALHAATKLRMVYLEAFIKHVGTVETRPTDDHNQPLKTTISAGLVFAHFKTSLRAVLHEAHDLLDKVAKDGNNRDSIAVSVLTGSGRTVQWVSSWTDDYDNALTNQLTKIADDFERDYSSGFFYNIRERFSLALDKDRHVVTDLPLEDLLVAEYLKNRERTADEVKAKHMVGQLVSVCKERKNTPKNDNAEKDTADDRYFVDGALLVRFLATKGRGLES